MSSDFLDVPRPLVLDGGLATQLENRGHDLTGTLWSARLLAEDPDAIRQVHRAYFAAGASVGISASYQASRQGFARNGMSESEADAAMSLSVRLVAEAREAAVADGAVHPMFVAASVGPYGAIRHDGSEYMGHYGLSHDEMVAFHVERLEVLLAADPDLLAIETIPDVVEAEALAAALTAVRSPVPAWLSFSCADEAHVNAGQSIEDAAAVVAGCSHIDAMGINCTKPEYVAGLIGRIHSSQPDLPIVVYPNAGRVWDGDASVWRGDGSDMLPAPEVRAWLDAGASAVGGCCGLGPTAIEEIRRVVDAVPQ